MIALWLLACGGRDGAGHVDAHLVGTLGDTALDDDVHFEANRFGAAVSGFGGWVFSGATEHDGLSIGLHVGGSDSAGWFKVGELESPLIEVSWFDGESYGEEQAFAAQVTLERFEVTHDPLYPFRFTGRFSGSTSSLDLEGTVDVDWFCAGLTSFEPPIPLCGEQPPDVPWTPFVLSDVSGFGTCPVELWQLLVGSPPEQDDLGALDLGGEHTFDCERTNSSHLRANRVCTSEISGWEHGGCTYDVVGFAVPSGVHLGISAMATSDACATPYLHCAVY